MKNKIPRIGFDPEKMAKVPWETCTERRKMFFKGLEGVSEDILREKLADYMAFEEMLESLLVNLMRGLEQVSAGKKSGILDLFSKFDSVSCILFKKTREVIQEFGEKVLKKGLE